MYYYFTVLSYPKLYSIISLIDMSYITTSNNVILGLYLLSIFCSLGLNQLTSSSLVH